MFVFVFVVRVFGRTGRRLEFSGHLQVNLFPGASDVLLQARFAYDDVWRGGGAEGGEAFVLTWNQYCSVQVRSIQIQNQNHLSPSAEKHEGESVGLSPIASIFACPAGAR